MRDPLAKILSLAELLQVRAECRERGLVVVQCHGCFDIVHPGHLRYLRFAKEQGDRLIVSVSGDEVVGKGPARPYVGEKLRAENLAAFEFVDYVTIDRHPWAGPVLEALRPDVYVKGREYATSTDPRFRDEKALVEGYGGSVIFSSGDVVYSSSYILERFRDRYGLEQQRVAAFCERHGITRERLDGVLRSFAGRRVLVVGDPILDSYHFCEAPALAAEAPVLSVTPVREEHHAGGAFLVASQLAQLGAEVSVLGPRGESSDHGALGALLDESGAHWLGPSTPSRPVFTKTRFVVDGQKVLQVNRGFPAPLSEEGNRAFAATLSELWEQYDAVVACDFGYGLMSPTVVACLNDLAARRRRPLYLDVSGRGQGTLLKVKGARLASPTEAELRGAFGDAESGLSNLASRLLHATRSSCLALTLHGRGAMLFLPAEGGSGRLPTDYLPSLHRGPVADAVGAGDVFLAGLLLCDLATGEPALGVYFGSCLAELHVSRLGNGPESAYDLEGLWATRPELQGS
jgi:rfaE bifunctional protein kinase chain/domain/rfaE bifunctional protein nucleotidyltransferase chain/domain